MIRTKKNPEDELWSLKEKRAYHQASVRIVIIDGISILATPAGEPLVVKRR